MTECSFIVLQFHRASNRNSSCFTAVLKTRSLAESLPPPPELLTSELFTRVGVSSCFTAVLEIRRLAEGSRLFQYTIYTPLISSIGSRLSGESLKGKYHRHVTRVYQNSLKVAYRLFRGLGMVYCGGSLSTPGIAGPGPRGGGWWGGIS